MGTLTPNFLSEQSNGGEPIEVLQTATSGTLLHRAVAGTTSFDEIRVFANNIESSSIDLTLELGGVGQHKETRAAITNGNGPNLVWVGRLNNSAQLSAYATSSGINITGEVDTKVP